MAFSGFHHIAICTRDMKAQIEFFTQVVGLPLVGLYPLHSGKGDSTFHCFIRIGADAYLSFVQFPGHEVEPVPGVSHATSVRGAVADGAMQHIAIHVYSRAELLALRDRLRANNCIVVGPADHGICESMYLGAPEGILLEFVATEGFLPVHPDTTIDADQTARCGMTPEDVARYVHPPAFASRGGAVPQPDRWSGRYPTPIPPQMLDQVYGMPDEQVFRFFLNRPEAMPAPGHAAPSSPASAASTTSRDSVGAKVSMKANT